MSKKLLSPDYIFESSWEVCNKVGGIYTVLSTRAKTLQDKFKDKIFFIGPDLWINKSNPLFEESKSLLNSWKKHAIKNDKLDIRIGRWKVPGKPIAILVDFQQLYPKKNQIYGKAWEQYGVDSLHAYGDYDEASMFSIAASMVVESFYNFLGFTSKDKIIYQAHEWMTAMGALYLKSNVPSIATIFTTHATTVGRAIAGNNKPLYDYLSSYNGDQMAFELNVQSKHSVEKVAAQNVDCFTTVSDITARECKQLLEKDADIVLMNGFEADFVPQQGDPFDKSRKKARKTILTVANALMNDNLKDDTLIVSIGGRYEYKNKGIDLFVDAINRLRSDKRINKSVLALILVPAWMKCPLPELKSRIHDRKKTYNSSIDKRITHNLYNQENDNVLNQMNWLNMYNNVDENVKAIFVPCYLDGKDGIFNIDYYDMLIGMDLCVYPSYYEPWGYTPMESVAFHVPCITTDLSGFGLWVNKMKGKEAELEDGVKVIHRSDYNSAEVSEEIKNTIIKLLRMDNSSIARIRKNASLIANHALWRNFIKYYYQAYDYALRKAKNRNQHSL